MAATVCNSWLAAEVLFESWRIETLPTGALQSRPGMFLLLGCKLLWLCNFEDSRTFSMKTKNVIFFCNEFLSLTFHQVFSSEFPLYGMLILFHKGTVLVRKKQKLRVLSV